MKLNSKIISSIFKSNKNEIDKFCSHLLKKKLNFFFIKGLERDKVLIQILKRIKLDQHYNFF